MNLSFKWIVCGVASVVLHVAIARALSTLPPRVDPPQRRTVEVQVVTPRPPPPIPPEPEPEKPPEPLPTPQPIVHDVPHTRPVHAPQVAAVAKDLPPAEHPTVVVDTTDTPVFGVTMESTSQGGSGPAVPIGNTTRAQPGPGSAAPAQVRPLAAPVAAYEATKLPMPQARCFGKYTDEAKAAGVEGSVVIDLIVGEDGRAREIVVAQGLPHGLTEAAIAALKDCRFTPGEKDGKPVPVKIRGFKVTFVIPPSN
jgi:protein TonB